VSVAEAAIGVGIGLVAGVLSGVFGVGGGILMTPGIQVLLGAPPIVALATPLPAILPTALTGALTYRRSGQIDVRAAALIVGSGLVAAAVGAWLTEYVDTTLLLIVTAILLGSQALTILRNADRSATGETREAAAPVLGAIGAAAGFVSGLLGIGGGLVIVPLLAGWLGMPLKRALGTSLLAIVALVIPGTIVHAVLGHIDGGIWLALTVGAVPGARLGARLALGAAERTLRTVVGVGLLLVALAYALDQAATMLSR
jgi:uncharacterized membrane protein YfcA